MNENKLKQLVADAVRLDRAIALQQEQLKEMKTRLITEARSRLEDTGETAIVFTGLEGDIARVNLPAPALKSKIDGEGKPVEKIRSLTGTCFENLFVPALTYVPIEGFRHQAMMLLGPAAPRLIKLCETESRPRVSFETKPSPQIN